MANVTVLDHPLIQHKLAILRSKDTPVKEFRELIGEIAALMCYEATRNLPTQEVEVETPVATAKCRVLAGKKMAIVPVLRAGLGMVDAFTGLGFLSALYGLIALIPGIAVAVRRLHDTGKSGLWLLVFLIPFIGWVILIYFMVQDSQPFDNQYGPNPKRVGMV